MKNAILKVSLLVLIATVWGCNSVNKANIEPNQVNSTPIAATATNIDARTDKIKFKTEGGSDLFSLKQQADGAKLVDGKEQELARIKADKSGKIKLKNSADKTLGYVVTKQDHWKVENPEQNKDLYILRKQNNGDYQLEDAAKKEIYQIKSRNDGLEILTPNNQLVYKIKVKEGKISLRNPSEKTIFSTKSGISSIAFACFGFDVMTREQQAALAYAVNSTGGR
ncbi:hypothetical protein H6G76_14735 [Nostoc sp. FACHB-152]|uniref:hypothetical protein n=1 Tax=unclassified Nostoc TaxID=2593658 RepID=UPI00168965CD|nr:MULTISPECIES: hypothetical protein [unclassified Nostoc]MBD2448392.1 hypothetical protein [Nostoc sp. FACHB-152]MBD2470832.1 hypothetical protein [Nostoc sp. FACHB-145]